jgi:2-amino-4-hydroxy-6-hydroxymethyldihydropteridine diphosphokinase
MSTSGPVRVFAALGSNMGDRWDALRRARSWLSRIADSQTLEASPIYETLPVGPGPQDCYLNQVVQFETTLNPEALLLFFKEVECWLGRRPRPRFHSREIDIDLLFFGSQTVQTADLIVPHERWAERSFVLVPLLDLAADFCCPRSGIRASELLLENCPAWESEVWSFQKEPALCLS